MKKLIVLFGTLFILFSIGTSKVVNAQSDGVIDQCTYYVQNGPVRIEECERRIKENHDHPSNGWFAQGL